MIVTVLIGEPPSRGYSLISLPHTADTNNWKMEPQSGELDPISLAMICMFRACDTR